MIMQSQMQDLKDSTINLTSKVTGTLPLANGGIGSTSLSGANITQCDCKFLR